MNAIKRLLSSIRFRLLAVYLLLAISTMLFMMLMLSRTLENAMLSAKITEWQKSLNFVAVSLSDPYANCDADTMFSMIRSYAQNTDGRMLILNSDCVVLMDSASLYNGYYLPYSEAYEVASGKSSSAYEYREITNSLTNDEEWFASFAQTLTVNGLPMGVLLCAVSVQDVESDIVSVQFTTTVMFICVVMIMLLLCIFLLNKMTSPIIELTNVMRNTTAKTYGRPVSIKAKGELGELVGAFNRMSTELSLYDKARDAFVANASHELKTPLASMKVLSESLLSQENPDPEMVLDFMGDINHEIDRLNNIVVTLLTIARTNSEGDAFERVPLELHPIVSHFVRQLEPLAEQKGLKLDYEMLDEPIIKGDTMRIERVVINIIDNAIKYTEKGYVHVCLCSDDTYAKLIVKDSGLGIPADALPHIFDRFYRVDKARSRATGGTGLGLSLVNDIVRLHDGFIDVTSEVGKGSVFTINIPLAKDEKTV